MTEQSKPTLIEEIEGTDAGAQGLAAANLAGQVMRLLHQALDMSDLDQRALANKVGVTQGRVSQVFGGDGNMRIASVARYLRALGYEAEIAATPVKDGLPKLPRHLSRRSSRNDPANADAGVAGKALSARLLESPLRDPVPHGHEREAKKPKRWVEVKPVLSSPVVDLASYSRWRRSARQDATYHVIMPGGFRVNAGHG
jgi:predicted XRE-type DNA-binding protein